MKTATVGPNEVTSAAVEETPTAAYPREVPAEDLTDLCDSSDPKLDQPSRAVGHYRFYEEIDGHFELVMESYEEIERDANNSVRFVYRDEASKKTGEARVIDGVWYKQFVIDDKETEWSAWKQDTSWLRKRPSGPDEICVSPMQNYAVAIDHGSDYLNGVLVRHVELFTNASDTFPVDYSGFYDHIVEHWVDFTGTEVQRRSKQVLDESTGDPTIRTIVERLWTLHYGPVMTIKPPDTYTLDRNPR